MRVLVLKTEIIKKRAWTVSHPRNKLLIFFLFFSRVSKHCSLHERLRWFDKTYKLEMSANYLSARQERPPDYCGYCRDVTLVQVAQERLYREVRGHENHNLLRWLSPGGIWFTYGARTDLSRIVVPSSVSLILLAGGRSEKWVWFCALNRNEEEGRKDMVFGAKKERTVLWIESLLK